MGEYKLPDLRGQREAIINPDLMLENLKKDFDPPISIGIWYFTPGGGRFHDRYVEDQNVEERIERAHGMAEYGVTGIEAHYPNEINEDNVGLYLELEKNTGIRVVGIPFQHFFPPIFEFGSMGSHVEDARKEAKKIVVGTLKMVKYVGADGAVSWPGTDGYTYFQGNPFGKMWTNYDETLAEAMDEVPGVRVNIEPKGYEPANNNIFRVTAEGILAAQRVESRLKNEVNKNLLAEGHALVGLNPEIGHVKMSFEILPAAYALCMMYNKLGHTHWNSQPDGNYDQDLNVGVVNWPEAEALLWQLWAGGYKGYFGVDINPEKMSVEKAVELNISAIRKMRDRVAKLPHEELIEAHLNPRENRGKIEQIIIDSM